MHSDRRTPPRPHRRPLGALRAIRVRLVLAVAVLLLVGAVNVVAHYWGARRRAATFQELAIAIRRQSLLTEVHNRLEQVRHRLEDGAARGGISEEERAVLLAELDEAPRRLRLLALMADPAVGGTPPLATDAERVLAAWRESLEHAAPLEAGLTAPAEPALSTGADRLVHVTLPAAMERERALVIRAAAGFRRTEETVTVVVWGTLLLSALVGGVLLYLALRRLPGSVAALEAGAERLGAGDLAHRIPVRGSDELSAVATRFNTMAGRLQERDELLRRRGEELRAATEAAEVAGRARSRFLANTSHELRTPLNAIIGYSEILMEEVAERGYDELLPDLRRVHEAGGHLLALIDDVLDLSRIEGGEATPQRVPVDLDELLRDAVRACRASVEAGGNRLQVEIAASLGLVLSDPVRLTRIVESLLSNAARFTHDGTVTISAALERIHSGQPTLALDVTDTGSGMTPEQVERLFEPFMKGDSTEVRHPGTTGLAITLARRHAQLMGGSLEVESTVGLGTRFLLRLPVEEMTASPCPAPLTVLAGRDSRTATEGER